jgi:putative transcriptional regulator
VVILYRFCRCQAINTIESNKYVPSTILALKIASVFDKPLGGIFMLEEGD